MFVEEFGTAQFFKENHAPLKSWSVDILAERIFGPKGLHRQRGFVASILVTGGDYTVIHGTVQTVLAVKVD